MDNARHRRSILNFDVHLVEILRSKLLRNATVMLLSVMAITLAWTSIRHTPSAPAQASVAAAFPVKSAKKADAGKIAAAHLFGQSPDALRQDTPARSNASVNVQGLIYSSDPDSALALLEVDGTPGVFRKGDVLPDGEKIAAIDVASVQLSDGISIRTVGLSQKFGNQVPGISINGAQDLMGDIAMMRSMNIPGHSLQPVSLIPGASPIDQLKALRQQLIKH